MTRKILGPQGTGVCNRMVGKSSKIMNFTRLSLNLI